MTTESSVQSALDKVIEIFAIQDKVRCFSYKNNESFNDLWNFKTKGVERIVIVWDGIPQRISTDPVNTGKYLTPVDWAAAFALSIYNNNPETTSYPKLKVIILDIYTEETSALRAGRTLMPWVRVIRQGKEDIISSLFDNNQENMRDSFADSGSDKPDMVALKNFWASMITRPSDPGDHHALANLIGPLLLIDDAGFGKGDPQIKALRTLMEAIGLMPSRTKENEDLLKNKWIDWTEYKLNDLAGNYNDISFILVDDMWQSGWGRILCHAVGATYEEKARVLELDFTQIGTDENGKIIVKATASADSILKKLERLIKEGKKDNRFELSFGGSDKLLEVLFLDLRLFAGKKTDSERKFFERVVNLAENFAVEGSKENEFPWRGFSEAEIDSVRRWIENKDKKAKIEDTDYILALTFLPRIIALMDLSLPIVLFSSTGRRDIVELFKDYGNIITVFDKPKFTVDIPVDIAKNTKGKFQTAIEASLAILVGRKKCKMIYGLKPERAREADGNKKHIELYIDEKEETGECYPGGLFAIFADQTLEQARMKADSFDDALVSGGVRYFDSLGFGPTTGSIKKKKNKSANELNTVINKSLDSKPEAIGFIKLANDGPGHRVSVNHSVEFDSGSGDFLFRNKLIALIEIFLSETLPALFGEADVEKISIAIYVGTRVKHYTSKKEKLLSEDQFRYGEESFSCRNGHFLYSINRNSIYPIVYEVLSFHMVKRNIHRALGIQLPYTKEPTEFPTYLICRVCKKNIPIDRFHNIVETVDVGNEAVLQGLATVTGLRKDKNGKLNAFIKTIETTKSPTSRNAIAFNRSNRCIDGLVTNQLIAYSELKTKPNGFEASGIRVLSRDEVKAYENAEKKYRIAAEVPLNCHCEKASFFPDCRALHYIADEVLGHVGEVNTEEGYGLAIKKVSPGGFDDKFNDDFKHLIKASRFLDQGDIVSSIVEIEIEGSEDLSQYKVKPLLMRRIATRLERLKGEDFYRLSVRLASKPRAGMNHANQMQKGMQSDTISNKYTDAAIIDLNRKLIKVIRYELHPKTRKPRHICEGEDGSEIIITKTEAAIALEKNPGILISEGVTLNAIVFFQNGKLFAKEIESLG